MNLSELPDFFALEHLGKALWRNGETRGAALLVGSGFSRFAHLPSGDSKKAPLWSDLRRSIISQIYAGAREPEIPTDPLRLAEEYRAMLGQAALDDFIRAQIPDQSWEPGEMHDLLLRLPWADVLTTNWDTLLERAAHRVGNISYETVSTANDLARARPPRIVKLHGTLPSGPFIFAEEDYRTYPIRHAAFVNLARQVFLENELCLLGFSGNDPNFLQWSGWVRDHLGDGARRIYLVGVLHLRSATRRLLELRNVAPIDLAPLVDSVTAADRHARAMQLFLDYLQRAEPRPAHAWSPERRSPIVSAEEANRRFTDKTYAAELLANAADAWRKERETYPGWLICPSEKRSALRYTTDEISFSKEALDKVEIDQRPRILFELAWRFDRAYWPIPEFLFDAIYQLIDSEPIAELTNPKNTSALSFAEYLDLAIATLRAARYSNKQSVFDRLAQIIDRHTEPGSDYRAEVAYQKSLIYRDRLQYSELVKGAPFVQGLDPIWKLRQANIRCELSDFAEAKRLVLEALAELRSRQQRDRNSLWVLSRRAWAEFLVRAADLGVFDPSEKRTLDRDRDWPLDFKAAKCDPWDELRHIEDDVDRALRDQETKSFDAKPHFDAGTYIEGDGGGRFRSWTTVPPSYGLDRLAEDAGLPVSFDMVSVRGDSSKRALAASFEPTEEWYLRFLQTLRSHTDELVERFLDRVSVATLSDSIIQPLIDKSVAAIQFWRTRAIFQRPDTIEKLYNTNALEKIRFLIEAVSRLVIRSDYKAKTLYDFALGLSKDADLQHWWLWEPTGHLLKRCGEAMTSAQKAELALSAIQFPLRPSVAGLDRDWPQPFEYLANSNYDRTQNAVEWNIRISELIQAVGSKGPNARSDAIMRLVHVHERRQLTSSEQDAFGTALYAQLDQHQLPANAGLYPFAFLNLPAPDPEAVKMRIAGWIYPKAKQGAIDQDILISIRGAALKQRPDDISLLPSRDDALPILDAVLAWRPKVSTGPIDFETGRSKRTAREIGPCLAHAIVPLLTSGDLTPERIKSLFSLVLDVPVPSALQILPLVLPLKPDLEERVTKAIRRAMMGGNFDHVAGAAHAIERWISHREIRVTLPRSLIEQLILAVSARQEIGLAALLWCANRLLHASKLTPADKEALADALIDLHEETRYGRVSLQPLQISLSVIRAECVRLAKQLAESGIKGSGVTAWLNSYKLDPLPEVRFALDNDKEFSD